MTDVGEPSPLWDTEIKAQKDTTGIPGQDVWSQPLSDAVAEWCPTRSIPPIVKDWKQGIKILKTVTSSTNIFLCLEHIVFGTQRCHIFKEFDQEKP